MREVQYHQALHQTNFPLDDAFEQVVCNIAAVIEKNEEQETLQCLKLRQAGDFIKNKTGEIVHCYVTLKGETGTEHLDLQLS